MTHRSSRRSRAAATMPRSAWARRRPRSAAGGSLAGTTTGCRKEQPTRSRLRSHAGSHGAPGPLGVSQAIGGSHRLSARLARALDRRGSACPVGSLDPGPANPVLPGGAIGLTRTRVDATTSSAERISGDGVHRRGSAPRHPCAPRRKREPRFRRAAPRRAWPRGPEPSRIRCCGRSLPTRAG